MFRRVMKSFRKSKRRRAEHKDVRNEVENYEKVYPMPTSSKNSSPFTPTTPTPSQKITFEIGCRVCRFNPCLLDWIHEVDYNSFRLNPSLEAAVRCIYAHRLGLESSDDVAKDQCLPITADEIELLVNYMSSCCIHTKQLLEIMPPGWISDKYIAYEQIFKDVIQKDFLVINYYRTCSVMIPYFNAQHLKLSDWFEDVHKVNLYRKEVFIIFYISCYPDVIEFCRRWKKQRPEAEIHLLCWRYNSDTPLYEQDRDAWGFSSITVLTRTGYTLSEDITRVIRSSWSTYAPLLLK